MHTPEIIRFFITVLTILNPINGVAIFISLTREMPAALQRRNAITTGLAGGVIMLICSWFGLSILHLFGIDIPSFRTAGGLVVLLIGLSMLHSQPSRMSQLPEGNNLHGSSIGVVPMAIPLTVGPGTISAIIITASSHPHFMDKVIISLVTSSIALLLTIVLLFAQPIGDRLGQTGIKVTTRIMGLILASVAVTMIAAGLKGLFPQLQV